MIEPIHSLERGEFHGLEVPPRPEPTNHLGFEEADDGFGERLVVRIPETADGGREAGVGQSIGVAHREVLRAAIALMHEPGRNIAAPVINRSLESVEDEVGRQERRDPLADDAAGEVQPGSCFTRAADQPRLAG
jgi:hypothetical protein